MTSASRAEAEFPNPVVDLLRRLLGGDLVGADVAGVLQDLRDRKLLVTVRLGILDCVGANP